MFPLFVSLVALEVAGGDAGWLTGVWGVPLRRHNLVRKATRGTRTAEPGCCGRGGPDRPPARHGTRRGGGPVLRLRGGLRRHPQRGQGLPRRPRSPAPPTRAGSSSLTCSWTARGIFCRRRGPFPFPGRCAGHEHRVAGRVQPWLEAGRRAGRTGARMAPRLLSCRTASRGGRRRALVQPRLVLSRPIPSRLWRAGAGLRTGELL